MARMPVPARCPAERLKANTFLIQLLREAGNIGTIAMRMAAGLAGIAVFGSTTYVVAFSMFCIALNLLQIHSISQSTFMVAVHVAMLVAAISARFGWKLFRQDAFIDRIQTAWSGITGARASRLNG